jgi:hypothetical protein
MPKQRITAAPAITAVGTNDVFIRFLHEIAQGGLLASWKSSPGDRTFNLRSCEAPTVPGYAQGAETGDQGAEKSGINLWEGGGK